MGVSFRVGLQQEEEQKEEAAVVVGQGWNATSNPAGGGKGVWRTWRR